MLRNGTSELGRIYLKKIQDGEICDCMLRHGRRCTECQREHDIQVKVEHRKRKIEKIKSKKS
jgi:hypothetical protein